MRAHTRRTATGEVGLVPTSPPEIDAIGGTNHIWVDTTTVSADAKLNLVDLFCGAGGIGLGFEQAGFRSILAVEMDEDAAATYQLNFPFCDLVLADIRDLSDEEILYRLDGVRVDVITAGWPCQGISPMGHQDPLDPRTPLYREAIRVARLLRPRAIVLENVPALLHPKFRWSLDDLLARLGDAGYANASVMVLDAADYRVPQHRKRVITLANRLNQPNPYPLPLPGQHLTVSDAISDLADHPDDEAVNHVRCRHSADEMAKMDRLRPGQSLSERYEQSGKRLHADEPSTTVLWGNGNLMVHPLVPRTLTVREAARLQGVPDDHLFVGSRTAQGRQVANGVPPPLARCLALALRPSPTLADGGVVAGRVVAAPNRAEIAGAGRGPAVVTKGHELTDEVDGASPALVPVGANSHVPYPDLPVSQLIEGDNLEALKVLRRIHLGRIDAIFADPPYNTGRSESYRNSFDREQWARALSERLVLARELLTEDGVICVTIDHFELFALGELMDSIFGRRNRLGIVTVVHNQKGRSGFDHDGFSEVNEYYLFYARSGSAARINPVPVSESELRSRFPRKDEEGLFTWHSLVRGGGRSEPEECPEQHYPVHADPVTGRMGLQPFDGSIEIVPLADDRSPRVWRCIPFTFERWARQGVLRVAKAADHPSGYTVQKKTRANAEGGRGHVQQPKTVWSDPALNAAAHGTVLLRRMIGDNPFSYPKSVHAVRQALRAMVSHKPDATILDFYAGSGTTAHALLMLNAEDDGRRTFILVNNNELTVGRGRPQRRICEEICLPRVRAAIDGYEYQRRGKTIRVAGLPGNVRYLRVREGACEATAEPGPADDSPGGDGPDGGGRRPRRPDAIPQSRMRNRHGP